MIGKGDTALGGSGTDIIGLSFSQDTVGITYKLSAASTRLANGTTISGFETLQFAGGKGVDTITGGANGDVLYGGDGNDKLTGGAGTDSLDGQNGNDTLSGGLGADFLTDSGTGDDTLSGGDGDDYLYNGLGVDKLSGDAGNDFFYLGDGDFAADNVNGGAGTDKISFSTSYNSVVIDLATQSKNDGGAIGDRFTSIESIEGSYSDDMILGDATANTLEGAGADDTLDGRGGNDRIDGGFGSDIMTGGDGADTFVLRADLNYGGSIWQADEVTDFKRGTDKLEISKYVFGTTMTFSSGAGISSGGAAPNLHFDTATSRLWLDQDGSGVVEEPILVATLQGVTALALTDFIIV